MKDDSTQAHAGRLRAALATISALHDVTFDPPTTSGRGGRTVPGSRLPVPVAPLSARADAHHVLHHAAHAVLEHRNLDVRLGDPAVPALAQWLTLHADHVIEHLPWLAVDVHDVAVDLERIAQPAGVRRATVGSCPHCAGTLIAWIDDHTELPGRIVCDHDGHTWDREHWQLLGRTLDPTPELLDATALATWLTRRFLTAVEPATVWQWARRGHITPANADGDGSRPLYDRTTVADWYLQRRSIRAG